MASGDVADEALQRTYYIVTHMLAGRPDILEAMKRPARGSSSSARIRFTPTCRNTAIIRNPTFQNERVRGTGGFDVTSFGEENLLNLALDRYDDESIGVHEFCHTIDAAIATIDSTWRRRKNEVYQNAVKQGL